jgi:hypothetical protein
VDHQTTQEKIMNKEVGSLSVRVGVQCAGVLSFLEYLQDAVTSGDITPVTATKLEELLKGVTVVTASPDANVEKNRQLLLDRSVVGLKKYGVTTERTDLNLSQWLQHLLEELMDAANYVQAAKNSVGDLQHAQDRLFDVLLGDDGQAHKEAERYLERANPALYMRLILQRDGIDINPSRDSLQP